MRGRRLEGIVLEPLGRGQKQVGARHGERRHVRVLLNDEVLLVVGLLPFQRRAHDGVLVAAHLVHDTRAVRLARRDGLAQLTRGARHPLVDALVRGGAAGVAVSLEVLLAHGLAGAALVIPALDDAGEVAVVLLLGPANLPTQAVPLEIRAELADALRGSILSEGAGAMGLVRRAGRLDAAEQRVDGEHALGSRGGALLVVGEHAARNAAPIGAHIQLKRLDDLIGLKPARLGGSLDRPGLGLFPVDLAGGFGLYTVDGCRGEQLGVNVEILRRAEGQRLDLARLGIQAHVGGRVVHAVLIGSRVHVIGPDILGLVGEARLGVDEERQVCPALAELLVVGLRVDDVANPCQNERIVRTRTDWQPHVGLRGFSRHIRVDDDSLHAQVGARVRQAVTTVGGFGRVGLTSPEHKNALGVVLAALGQLGSVHNAHPALGVIHVDAAVETHAAARHEVARHGALAGAAGKRVAPAKRGVDRACLPLDVGSTTATGMPI